MIDLLTATQIVDAALLHARQQKMPPMTVAVLDARGCLVAFKSEDGSSLLRESIARAKAWRALGMGIGTRSFVERAKQHAAFFVALDAMSAGRVVPVPGGVLVRESAGGSIIGAVGVSGDLSDRDEACATAGIASTGQVGDPGS